MRKHRLLAAAATAAALTTLITAAPARAADDDTVLTSGSAAGTAVPAGAVISSALAAGTQAIFATGETSGLFCDTSGISATVTDNPAAPGSATVASTLTLSDCSVSGIFGVLGVDSLTVSAPLTTTISSDGTVAVAGTETAPVQATLNLNTLIGPISCTFTATGNAITGTIDNTGNAIAFAGQQFDRTGGSTLCSAAGSFTASYAPVSDEAGSPVFVN